MSALETMKTGITWRPATAADDRAVEVREPVVGQRDAREVGDLGREVALDDALADRDVDEEVAPVPAARDPADGDLVPGVRGQDAADEQRWRRRRARTAPARGERRRGHFGGQATAGRRGRGSARRPARGWRRRGSRRWRTRRAGRSRPRRGRRRCRGGRRRRSRRRSRRPAGPPGPRRGTTRLTRSQPGTANRNGQATTIATGGASQARANATTRAMAAAAATASGRLRTGGWSATTRRAWARRGYRWRSRRRDDRRVRNGPTILHVDLDAFFAAVEQRDRPGAARPAR